MAVLNGNLFSGTSGIVNIIHNVSGTNVTNSVSSSYAKVSPNVTGIYFNVQWSQDNVTSGAITEYYDLSNLLLGRGNSFIGAGSNTNIVLAIYYDVAASYDRVSNTSNGYLARYSAGATAVFTRNSSGTWALPLADTKVDGYASDSTNFPSSRSALVLNPTGSVPAFRFIGRASAPADAQMLWAINGLISISE